MNRVPSLAMGVCIGGQCYFEVSVERHAGGKTPWQIRHPDTDPESRPTPPSAQEPEEEEEEKRKLHRPEPSRSPTRGMTGSDATIRGAKADAGCLTRVRQALGIKPPLMVRSKKAFKLGIRRFGCIPRCRDRWKARLGNAAKSCRRRIFAFLVDATACLWN